jgi:DNA-binding winged helix-turn-helix (wHTH) protein
MHLSGNKGLAAAAHDTTHSHTATPLHELVAFEGYLVDRRRWLITHGGEPIPLKRKAFDLLLYFLDHRDEAVDKDSLMRALWGNLIVEESNVTQQIFLLRKALSRHESAMKIIETIPGRGYRFVPTLAFPTREPATSAVFLRAQSEPALERVRGRQLRFVRPRRLRLALLARARRADDQDLCANLTAAGRAPPWPVLSVPLLARGNPAGLFPSSAQCPNEVDASPQLQRVQIKSLQLGLQ